MPKIHLKVREKIFEYEAGLTLETISRDFQKAYPHDIILARVDGKLAELMKTIDEDVSVEFITTGEIIGNEAYRRTASMMMLKAFQDVMGRENFERLTVQYSLDRGYYCELISDTSLTKELLDRVKLRMQEIQKENIPIIKKSMPKREAIEIFREHKMYDKVNLFHYRRSSRINVYTLEDTVDYFYGYMAPNTSYVRYFDLYLYDDGFVLQMPEPASPETVDAFEPPEKLFNVLKQSARWGELLGVRTVADINNALADGSFSELMLVQEALQEKKIAEIAESIIESGKRIILIAGPSSSGKTTFSHRLSIQLRAHGLKPHPIPVDNYFVNREDTPLDEYGKPNFECLEALDIKELNKDLHGLLAGEEVELPVFNFVTGKREMSGEKMKIGDRDVLVIEGIHSLNDAMTYSIDQSNKFKIYISALTQLNIDEHNRIPTTDARLLRRIVRDAAKRGTNAAKTISMWQSVRRGEEENIFPYQENCDVMFNSVLIYELAILKQYAEPLLFSVREDQPEYETAKYLIKFLGYFLGASSENVPNNSILREFIGGSCFNVG
ncbi:nucleoside kinase [Coprococcus catus]|uniref:nucleoside kinase n=1 Tax=Coprococcus catus TaxID=116085 RepID=UPI001C8C2FD3|nr:nucleoside kinase [Coprococcus catus]MBX9229919.1 nucleoside kinase [Coprococcus catus]MCT6799020.1 nucleoside kinase [Coprococcus catus]